MENRGTVQENSIKFGKICDRNIELNGAYEFIQCFRIQSNQVKPGKIL